METEKTLTHGWNGESVSLAVKTSSGRDNRPEARCNGIVWLSGFRSDMAGTKAEAMVAAAADLGLSSLRFDYSGHGQSGGRFTDGTISRWVDESLHAIRSCTQGPQLLIGSSMGGWIALRVVEELQRKQQSAHVAGLLLIAPAPDFTSELMEPQFSAEQRKALDTDGYFEEPSAYSDEPNLITRNLIEDGRRNRILGTGFAPGVPVHIVQGMQDPDVPWQHAMRLVEELSQDDVTTTLVKDGDHRLSRDVDLALLVRLMKGMAQN